MDDRDRPLDSIAAGAILIGLVLIVFYAVIWIIKAPIELLTGIKRRRARREKERLRSWRRGLAESEIEALFGKQGDWSRYKELG